MFTDASYMDREENLGVDGVSVAVVNTFIGALAGFVDFPLLFAQGVSSETAGPGAIFVSLPTAFAEVPGGAILGFVYVFIVLITALSSAILLLEVVVS